MDACSIIDEASLMSFQSDLLHAPLSTSFLIAGTGTIFFFILLHFNVEFILIESLFFLLISKFIDELIQSTEKLRNSPSVRVPNHTHNHGQHNALDDDNNLFLQFLHDLSLASTKLSSQSSSSMNNRMGSTSNLSPASSILLTFADSTAGNLLHPLFFHFLSSISVCLFSSGEKVRSLYLEMQKVGLINGNLRAIDNLLGELTETEGRGVEEIDPFAGLLGEHSDGSKRWLGSADAIIAEVVLT